MNQSHYNYKDNKRIYQCPKCGLHYKEEKYANQCEMWCKGHESCNLDITGHAIESNQKN